MMDLVDIIAEKRFLGQEFLTWLWYKSEERGGAVLVPDYGDIQLVFEKHMLLLYGDGQSMEKIVCTGLQAELQEARTGLLMGKKLEQARIRLARDDYEWQFTLTATLFEFRNVRLPKTMSESEEGLGPEAAEGRILERVGMTEEVARMVNDLFRLFLDIRIGPAWDDELRRLRAWVIQSAGH